VRFNRCASGGKSQTASSRLLRGLMDAVKAVKDAVKMLWGNTYPFVGNAYA
jgi:hypothetical protein